MALSCRAQIQLSERNIQLGVIPAAYEIKGDVILKNTGNTKIFLMRADAEPGLKVYTSKKTLLPGDTALLILSFFPESKGYFNKEIKVVSSDKAQPHLINLSGTLQILLANNKQACYYFGRQRAPSVTIPEEPIVVKEPAQQRDVSNKIPDRPEAPAPSPPVKESTVATAPPKVTSVSKSNFSPEEYKPNNLLFLVDVSGSMRDSTKLPVMKSALHRLIDEIRDIDSVSFVTYADTVKVLCESVSGTNKQLLHQKISALKAKGVTQGRKAIKLGQQLVQKHYVTEGNNQIIIATDGIFKFEKADHEAWRSRQGNKPVTIGTVAFGNEREALRNLKELARKGGGGFVHIKPEDRSGEKLVEEIKVRSKK
jgi:Mg-chelatase subunit ChlD